MSQIQKKYLNKNENVKRRVRGPGVDRKGCNGRPKKRAKIFHGSKVAKNDADTSNASTPRSEKATVENTASNSTGYRSFHLETLFRAVRENLNCKRCGGSITISEVGSNGLGDHTYGITCEKCLLVNTFTSCPTIENK